MTEIDRRTALLMALLGAVAPSAADAQAPAADTHHDMSMAPANWSHPDEVAMLVYPRMTALDLIGPQYMFASLMGARPPREMSRHHRRRRDHRRHAR